jgi:hypothetical protein
MNRGVYIALVPALLVTVGYLAMFHASGISPNYPRLIGAMIFFFGAIYLLHRRNLRKEKASKQ